MELTIASIETINISKSTYSESCGDYRVVVNDDSCVNHVWHDKRGTRLFVAVGSFFRQSFNEICNMIENNKTIYDVDGSFVFAVIDSNNGIKVISEREGLIPLYYRIINDQFVITTRCDYLFSDFNYNNLDYSSLYDYLRYGMMIGNHTFHKDVKLLAGGSTLTWSSEQGLYIEKNYFFHHDSDKEESDPSKLMEEINSTYINAIRKRIDRPISQMSVFLSGGMDSRMVLAGLNKCDDGSGKASCISFGQFRSEEVDVARTVSELHGNPFIPITLIPYNHIADYKEYLKLTCGSDMFPQSYIIGAAKQIRDEGITAFMTGSFLECHLGGTFLPESALDTTSPLSEYLDYNLANIKCELFKANDLNEYLTPGAFKKYFEGNTDNLREESSKYDDYPVKDIIQSFIIDNRDKRLVLNRETIPGLYLDYINPNFDIDFLRSISKIPAKYRIQRCFYRDFLIHEYPDYSDILYNNTTLPVSAPLELWKEGSRNEHNRELLFVEYQKQQNGDQHRYYTHFYSDFDGYSRYDKNWIDIFETTLLSENSIIVGDIFDRQKIREMLLNHVSCKNNYRKYLIALASLELFFRSYLL